MRVTRMIAVVLIALLGTTSNLRAQAATATAAEKVDPAIAPFLSRIEPAAGDDELRQKLKERHNMAVDLLHYKLSSYGRGMAPIDLVFDAARAVGEAKLELAQSDQERKATLEQALAICQMMEVRLQMQFNAGISTEADLIRAKLARLNVEVELLKLKQPRPATTAKATPGATTQP